MSFAPLFLPYFYCIFAYFRNETPHFSKVPTRFILGLQAPQIQNNAEGPAAIFHLALRAQNAGARAISIDFCYQVFFLCPVFGTPLLLYLRVSVHAPLKGVSKRDTLSLFVFFVDKWCPVVAAHSFLVSEKSDKKSSAYFGGRFF